MNPGIRNLETIYTDERTFRHVRATCLTDVREGTHRTEVRLFTIDPHVSGEENSVSALVGFTWILKSSDHFGGLPDKEIEGLLSELGLLRLKRALHEGKRTGPLPDLILATDTWREYIEQREGTFRILDPTDASFTDRQVLKHRILHFMADNPEPYSPDKLMAVLKVNTRRIRAAMVHARELGLVVKEGTDWMISEKGEDLLIGGKLKELIPLTRDLNPVDSSTDLPSHGTPLGEGEQWDAFICYAGEDRDEVAGPLANELKKLGAKIWYDRWELGIGDGLRRNIDAGLSGSRFGIVVLSPQFFAKNWSQRELDGLVAKEMTGAQSKVILPVWHGVTEMEIVQYSPTLADRMAGNTKVGIERLALELYKVIQPSAAVNDR